MAIKNYMINDKWLDIAKQNIVEVESTDGVIGSVKVNGEEYGGGGGSSDFSTAEVTLIVGTVSYVAMQGACIRERGGVGSIRTSYFIEENTTSVTQAVLYQGMGFVMIDTEATVSVSGNIQEVSTGYYSITGDCTITIS